MKKHELIVIGAIAAVIIGIVLIQTGIRQGRLLASEESGLAGAGLKPARAEIDILKEQLTAARFDLEVEQEKLAILLCESNIRHEGVWGDGGRSYGIAQFQQATFNDLKKEAGRPQLRWMDREDQLWLLDWALRNGYGEYWTCYGKTAKAG